MKGRLRQGLSSVYSAQYLSALNDEISETEVDSDVHSIKKAELGHLMSSNILYFSTLQGVGFIDWKVVEYY